MKNLTSLAAFLLILIAVHAGPGPVLKINYPASLLSTGLTFRVYFSDVPTAPLTNWMLLTTQVGTNTVIPVEITTINRYYAVQASNLWGASFSGIVLSPAALLTNITLYLVP